MQQIKIAFNLIKWTVCQHYSLFLELTNNKVCKYSIEELEAFEDIEEFEQLVFSKTVFVMRIPCQCFLHTYCNKEEAVTSWKGLETTGTSYNELTLPRKSWNKLKQNKTS